MYIHSIFGVSSVGNCIYNGILRSINKKRSLYINCLVFFVLNIFLILIRITYKEILKCSSYTMAKETFDAFSPYPSQASLRCIMLNEFGQYK